MEMEVTLKNGETIYTDIDFKLFNSNEEQIEAENNIIKGYLNDPNILTINGKTPEEWKEYFNN